MFKYKILKKNFKEVTRKKEEITMRVYVAVRTDKMEKIERKGQRHRLTAKKINIRKFRYSNKYKK